MQYRARQTREPTKSAEAILKMLRTSASTRFEDYKIVTISYPGTREQSIQQLTKDAKKALAADPEAVERVRRWSVCHLGGQPAGQGARNSSRRLRRRPGDGADHVRVQPVRAVNPYFGNEVAVRGGASGIP